MFEVRSALSRMSEWVWMAKEKWDLCEGWNASRRHTAIVIEKAGGGARQEGQWWRWNLRRREVWRRRDLHSLSRIQCSLQFWFLANDLQRFHYWFPRLRAWRLLTRSRGSDRSHKKLLSLGLHKWINLCAHFPILMRSSVYLTIPINTNLFVSF